MPGSWGLAGTGQPPPFNLPRTTGAASCKDCHTVPTVERGASLPFVMLTEYSIWKTQDKHAQAYAVLKGELGQQMGRLLKADVLDPKTGCLNCHAMNSLAQGGAEQFNPTDGVSCGGCHGPSEKWLEAHKNPAWRKKTPQEKAELGMTDLRNPHTRADLCMSCHVGNATQGKVVTHPMFAAGHPPLPPIEVASFSKNEPQHWARSQGRPVPGDSPGGRGIEGNRYDASFPGGRSHSEEVSQNQ